MLYCFFCLQTPRYLWGLPFQHNNPAATTIHFILYKGKTGSNLLINEIGSKVYSAKLHMELQVQLALPLPNYLMLEKDFNLLRLKAIGYL